MAKKLFAVILAALMVLSLAACNSSTGKPEETEAQTTEAAKEEKTEAAKEDTTEAAKDDTTAAPKDGVIELTFDWWGNDARHEATLKAIDLFNETHDNIHVTCEYMAWDGFWDKMPVLSASNALPDVLQMDSAYIHTYVDNGVLADITDKIDLTDIMTQDQIDIYKIDDVLYGAPVGTNGCGFTYVKSTLDKYGIPYPTPGWTWDEFTAWAKDAASKLPDGVWVMGDPRGNAYESMQNYVESKYNVKILGFDGSFNFDAEQCKEFFNYWQDMADAGVVPPAQQNMSMTDGDATSDGWINGSLLLRSSNIGNVNMEIDLFPEEVRTDIGVCSQPVGDYGAQWYQSTMFYCVAENSPNKEAAVELIKWIVSDIEAGKILQTVRGMPVSNEVYEAIEPDLTVSQRVAKELQDVVAPYATAYWNNTPNDYADWVNEFKANGEAIMLGEMTVDEVAEHLAVSGQQIYDDLH